MSLRPVLDEQGNVTGAEVVPDDGDQRMDALLAALAKATTLAQVRAAAEKAAELA